MAFETLQTEYWVASFEAVRAELERRGIEMIEAVADNDANRQLEQIHTFIAQGVDSILVAPKDATTVIPTGRTARVRRAAGPRHRSGNARQWAAASVKYLRTLIEN